MALIGITVCRKLEDYRQSILHTRTSLHLTASTASS